MRRPAPPPIASTDEATPAPPRPFHYVAIGNTEIDALFGKTGSGELGWATLLLRQLPAGTLFSSLGEHDRTLQDANTEAIPAAIQMNPDVVTLWNVIGDSTGGTPLTSYLTELRKALDLLTKETEAQIVLPNMPDITLLMQDQSEDRNALVRGGIEQWNRVIAQAASRYGRRVLVLDLYPISEQILDPINGNATLADTIWNELKPALPDNQNAQQK